MSTYAIGDLQGCFEPLTELLTHINYNKKKDTLWFAGDLVNRGPDSLACLRFVKNLGHRAFCVLGNHDLHLLAIHQKIRTYLHSSDTIQDILNAPDCDELLHWLRHQPLMFHQPKSGFSMIHAGLPPQWNFQQAKKCAEEVEYVLQHDYENFLAHMYGNEPAIWSDNLSKKHAYWDRLRFITNCLTRLRFCDSKGKLLFKAKGAPNKQDKSHIAWFDHPQRKSSHDKIIFGHWSTLPKNSTPKNIYHLDTGCLWGGELTALRLEDEKYFSIPCQSQ
jgi:bis(5'-nucleosyl)-tetraphosphatase (symmetrical)